MVSCFVVCMLNIMPLERIKEGEELRKEANSVHVAGLNVTENQQDREDSSRDLEPERSKGYKSVSKESSRSLEANSVHIGLKITESKQERRQWLGARTRALEKF